MTTHPASTVLSTATAVEDPRFHEGRLRPAPLLPVDGQERGLLQPGGELFALSRDARGNCRRGSVGPLSFRALRDESL